MAESRGPRLASRRIVWAGLAGVLLGSSARDADADPMQSFPNAARTESSLGPDWGAFLAGGPERWAMSSPRHFPPGLQLTSSQGRLVASPMNNYLFWRRSLNPMRFDQNHPAIGPQLEQLIPPPSPPVIPPGSTREGGPPILNPQPEFGIPEPGTLSTALVLIGASVWYRWRLGRID
ncbi:MAG: hypothetical protein NVSMB9_17560 [Isosphaeraceae bacterium]